MKFALIILGVVAFFVLIGYLRLFIKRVTTCFKVRSACNKAGARLITHSPLWFLALNRGKKWDFAVEKENEMLAVKLFAIKGKLNDLHLGDNGSYTVKKRIMLFSRWHSATMSFFSNEKHRPAYDFSISTEKSVKPILLIAPAPLNIRYGKDKILGNGDSYDGMTIMSVKGLEREINA